MTDLLTATAAAIAVEDVKQWRGQDVLDARGHKLGKLDEVYYDTQTDAPAFAAVKSGRFGKRVTLATLAGASAGQTYLRVAIDKGTYKDAPSFDPQAELTVADEMAAYEYFGLDYRPAGQGARRLAKH